MSVDTKRRFLLFLDPDPHLASLFIFGKCAMMCVCVCGNTCVCASEHNFGVATNHGKFKV